KAAAPADQQQQAATGVVVVLVLLEMLGEIGDASGQERDLRFRRTGVGLVQSVIGQDLLLLLGSECQRVLLVDTSARGVPPDRDPAIVWPPRTAAHTAVQNTSGVVGHRNRAGGTLRDRSSRGSTGSRRP